MKPLLALLASVLLLSPSACGGRAIEVSQAIDAGPDPQPGPAPGPHPEDAGPGPTPGGPCPDTAPAAGSACSRENLLCEYGTDPNPSCNAVFQCQSGTWQSQTGPGTVCQTWPESPSCPGSLGDIQQGASCSPQMNCYYPAGLCTCSPPLGGPAQIDAGSSWNCLPETGCPYPRPRQGSACNTPNETCTYYACDYAQQCQGGVWQGLFEGCAQGAGGV